MNEPKSNEDGKQLDEFEEKMERVDEGLREAFAAGFSQAIDAFDIEADFDTSVSALKKNEAVREQHYYYWDGKSKPLVFWLREQFSIDDIDDVNPRVTEELVSTKRISSEVDIREFLSSLEVPIHNKWVDLRSREHSSEDYETVELVVSYEFRNISDEVGE